MLLNKTDLLKAKVLEGHFKIETYFPEYSAYQLPTDSELIVFYILQFNTVYSNYS